MFLFFLILFAGLLASPVRAEPIQFLLQSSYRPTTLTFLNTQTPVSPTPTPTPSVLGTSTTISDNPTPFQVGGDGQIITIGLMGDSMTQTLGPDFLALQKSLRTLYPKVKFNVINYGKGSQTIEDWIKNIPNTTLYDDQPDILILESFAYNNFGNSQVGYDRYWLSLGSLTTQLKKQLPTSKILLASSIAPNSLVFGNAVKPGFTALEKIEKSKTIRNYLDLSLNFAKSQGYPVADAYHPSLNLISQEGELSYIDDSGIHPNSAGQEFYAKIVTQAIFDNKLVDSSNPVL